ncbi:SR-related and CTD-associated factor 4 isoform 2-T2 [Mantella aurantiaca]
MDAVNAFNQELFSLMDMKPPISRAKMILITKAAIKAIKLYKHVVQIVEKFIKKCKPEYKVPGLYVIDSIVRQSRHQFGIDKDVFGPRFTKNLTASFQCLYLCPEEDKSKIVRVLNLWQKNGVFKIEIIQPLLDMAAGAAHHDLLADISANEEGSSPPSVLLPSDPPEEPSVATLAPIMPNPAPSVPQLPSSEAFAAVAQLFQSSQGQQLQQILQTFQQPPKPQSPVIDENLYSQVQSITAQINTQPQQSHQPERKTAFDKLLERFDYDDEPEAADEPKKDVSSPTPPSQPPFPFTAETNQPPVSFSQIPGQMPTMDQFQALQPRMIGMTQEALLNQIPVPSNGQFGGFGMIPPQTFPTMMPHLSQESPQPFLQPAFSIQQNDTQMQIDDQQEISMEIEQPSVQESKRPSERQRSVSRSPKRRRSRSGSRSRRSRHRRSRSRSRDRRRHSPKSRSQEKRDREKERERRVKGLPPIKADVVSVCSTTLWVGQLDKRTTQQDVGSLLEEFGPIESINMIPPRGCAYIVMVHRMDAYRALQKLSRGNYKVNTKAIKIAWALNKGIKPEYKQYWDVEIGVTYIPWSKVKAEDLETLCEGGMLDNDTMCPNWKIISKKTEVADASQNGSKVESAQNENNSPATQTTSVPMLSLQPLPGTQSMPSMPPLSAVPAIQTLQPTAALSALQGLPPPQGLHPPQGILPPQVLSIPPALPPLQAMHIPQGIPVPGFPGPINIPPPGFAPGLPPPPFMRPGFNPMQLPPGFLPPPGMPPPMTHPVSMPPPMSGISIPTSTAGAPSIEPDATQAKAIPFGTGTENIDSEDNGNGYGAAPQGGPKNSTGPMNPLHDDSQGASSQGPQTDSPAGQSQGPPGPPQAHPNQPHGPQQGPPGPPQGPPHSAHGPPQGHPGPPQGHPGPPQGHPGPPQGHPGPPQGHPGPPQGHPGPPQGHPGPPQGHPGPPQGHPGPPQGHPGPPQGHPGPSQAPPQGPRPGPPQGPQTGPYQGPTHGAPPGPSTGLLGARPGLIPLQRPPGVPPPHMQRFPGMPHRQMPPHMVHRGPPGPGGFGMPPPHGMRGPYPPQGHFGRGGPGGPEEREGRPFRNERRGFNPERGERHGFNPERGERHGFNPDQNDRHQFNPEAEEGFEGEMEEAPEFNPENQEEEGFNPETDEGQGFNPERPGFKPDRPGFRPGRPGFHPDRPGFNPERPGFHPERNERPGFHPERERFGRRSFGNRNEDDREQFGGRFEDNERAGRGRRNWGRGSPDRERHREPEGRSRWSGGREREPRRPLLDFPDNRKPDVTENHEPPSAKPEPKEPTPDTTKEKPEPAEKKPTEEKAPKEAPPADKTEKDAESKS